MVRRLLIAGLAGALLLAPGLPGKAEDGGGDLRALYARPISEWPAAQVDSSAGFRELAPLELRPAPDAALRRLGARLFHDPLLSASGKMSCATCHDPALALADGRALPLGAPLSGRHTPSLQSVAYRASLGWDGATTSLEQQSLRPLLAHDEMGNRDLGSVVARVSAAPGYEGPFADAFGENALDTERLAEALVAFQAGLEEETRFDAFLRGDRAALSDQEIRGLDIFRTKGGCANCHFGPLLSDERFHNLGLSAIGEPREDLGRYRVTGAITDAGRFRTPSLRHVGRTAPYMHNGLFPTLEGVVNLYARGGGDIGARSSAEAQAPLHRAAARVDPLLRPLELDAGEKAALVAFLRSL